MYLDLTIKMTIANLNDLIAKWNAKKNISCNVIYTSLYKKIN